MNCDLVILLGWFSTMMILNLKSFKLLTHGLPNDTIDLLLTQNPNLNWWLLLHYRDGAGIVTKSECLAALRDKQPNYQKGKVLPITLDQVKAAQREETRRTT